MGYALLALALVLNALANLLLKLGAARLGPLAAPGLAGRVLGDWPLLLGLLLFALNVALYALALTRLELSVAYLILVAGGLVIVVAASALVLGERVTPMQGLGLALLVLGVLLVGRGGRAWPACGWMTARTP
jgi:multidrug transporter EmrE-like cation transporter